MAVSPGTRSKHVGGALDAAIGAGDADHVDGDRGALYAEPGPFPSLNRDVVEARPDRIDDEIAEIAEQELGEDAESAQRRPDALGTVDCWHGAITGKGEVTQADRHHAEAAELRDIGRQGPRAAKPERDVLEESRLHFLQRA